MGISIKQLILNTKVKKKDKAEGGGKEKVENLEGSGSMSAAQKEEIIEECIRRVAEYIEYELKP